MIVVMNVKWQAFDLPNDLLVLSRGQPRAQDKYDVAKGVIEK